MFLLGDTLHRKCRTESSSALDPLQLSFNHWCENTEIHILLIFFQLDIVSLFRWQLGCFLPGKLFNISTFCQEESGVLLQILNSFDSPPQIHRSDFPWKVSDYVDETLVWCWLWWDTRCLLSHHHCFVGWLDLVWVGDFQVLT